MNILKKLKKTLLTKLDNTEVGTEAYDKVLDEYTQLCETENKKQKFHISGDAMMTCLTYLLTTAAGWLGTEAYGALRKRYSDDLKPHL